MTVNQFINQLDLFLPNRNAKLEVKVAGSEALHNITVFGGENKVTFYIKPIKGEAARKEADNV